MTPQGRFIEQQFIYILSFMVYDKFLNIGRNPNHTVYITYYYVWSLFAAII
jgi:hypothetical protein